MLSTLKMFSFLVQSEEFLLRHKKVATNFTRCRKLPFSTVLTLILRKSVKSLQVVLNEWCQGETESISASALSQARQKFSHTAFIELLEKSVVGPMYDSGNFKKFKGHRLLAIDGSTLRLPTSKELIAEFGTMKYLNGKQQLASDNVESKASVLYDVLNEIPIAGSLHEARTNDLKAAVSEIALLQPGDIVMADRGYCSFAFFSEILGKKADFVIRLRDNMYPDAHQLFSDSAKKEIFAQLDRPKHCCNNPELPAKIAVRFIRVELADGEVEVLVTSLLNTDAFKRKDFKKLYYRRWRIETFFQKIKSRLALDNFTGRTVEAIKQDFYSTLFISGLETILSEGANNELALKNTQHPQKVNKAVSFNAIKNRIILLMFDPPTDFEAQVKKMFLLNPTLERPQRIKEKERLSLNSNSRSLYFQKFSRKVVF